MAFVTCMACDRIHPADVPCVAWAKRKPTAPATPPAHTATPSTAQPASEEYPQPRG